MKKLALLSILLLATLSLSVKASDVLCSEDKGIVGGTIFYKSFLYSNLDLKQPYTFFYYSVDNVLDKNIKASCPKLSKKPTSAEIAKMESFINNQHALCNATCEEEAISFHEAAGTKFFVGSKIRQLQNECKAVCQFSAEKDLEALREY